MKDRLHLLAIRMKSLLEDEQGQDLIEYGLLVALVAFAATVGMGSLATSINAAFVAIGTKLSNAV